jgi:hypothetical protein
MFTLYEIQNTTDLYVKNYAHQLYLFLFVSVYLDFVIKII